MSAVQAGMHCLPWDNRSSEAARCVNTKRPLTHLIDLTDRQDEMNDTCVDVIEEKYHLRLYNKLRYEGDCLVFTGFTSPTGYGRLHVGAKTMMTASRAAWIAAHGPIPDGLCVLHRCDNPPCCDVDHLFLGTQLENIADCVAKGRTNRNEIQLAKTHCPQGHPYSGDNLRIEVTGRRRCRTCDRDRVRVRSHARRAAAKRNSA